MVVIGRGRRDVKGPALLLEKVMRPEDPRASAKIGPNRILGIVAVSLSEYDC